MPLKVAINPNSADYGTFFLELDEARHRDQRFKIRLKYNGARSVVTDPVAKDRIYAAALTIDGLDSFYHVGPGGSLAAKFVFPPQAKKWILTAPGRVIVKAPNSIMRYPAPYAWGANTNPPTPRDDPRHQHLQLGNVGRIKNGAIQNFNGPGHSVVDVRGFQNGAKYADSFVFKTGGDSLANLAGSIADVGEIKVYFYGEELPLPMGIALASRPGGVGAGAKITNPVFPIQLRLDNNPHEVWTIKYRYVNSKNPPPGGLVPVTPTVP